MICRKHKFPLQEFKIYTKYLIQAILKEYVKESYVNIENFGLFSNKINVGTYRHVLRNIEVKIPSHVVPLFIYDTKARDFINGYNYFEDRTSWQKEHDERERIKKEKYKQRYAEINNIKDSDV